MKERSTKKAETLKAEDYDDYTDQSDKTVSGRHY